MSEIIECIARFECKFVPEPNSGCWLWDAAVSRDGYGNFNIGGGSYLAHRVAYALYCGPVAGDIEVCHTCDMPACVNPAHLFLGSHAENMRDMFRKGRRVRKVGVPGAGHWNAKLSAVDVASIRASTAPQLELAAAYGISRNHVSRLRCGGRWSKP